MFKRKKNHMVDVTLKNIPDRAETDRTGPDASLINAPHIDALATPSDNPDDTLTLGEAQHVSIISNDLTILGSDLKIISKGAIRVDGEIRGEIQGVDVTVGRRGRVTGMVTAKRVIIDGEVSGEIQAGQVTLRPTSRVNGDIHHMSLTIDQGAMFEGGSKRRKEAPELAVTTPADAPAMRSLGTISRTDQQPNTDQEPDPSGNDWSKDLQPA